METAVKILFATLMVLLVIIGYRLLLNRLSRNRVRQEEYCVLYSLEHQPSSGEVEFYFIAPHEQEVEFVILKGKECIKTIGTGSYSKGGHIIRFDTNEIPNGDYFYGIKTNMQETLKRMRVKN
jgi:hypothetical protein